MDDKLVAMFTAIATGASGDLALEKEFLASLALMYHVFCTKQADYGPNNIASAGDVGVVVRMGDKMSRLRNLYGLTSAGLPSIVVHNESIEDSFIDIANYGVIARMCLLGAWPEYTEVIDPAKALAVEVINLLSEEDDPRCQRLCRIAAQDLGG